MDDGLARTHPRTCTAPMIDGDNSGNALTAKDGGRSLAIDPGDAGAGVCATGGDGSLLRYCSYASVRRGHRRR